MIILMEPEKNFEESVEFYKNLGLNPKFHLKGKWAEFEKDGVLIGLAPTEQDLPERRTGVVMEVEDLKNKYEETKASFEFLGEPVEAIHGIMISIKDPGGNIFDLYQPTPEKVKDLARKAAEEGGCQGSCQDCEHAEDETCKDEKAE